MTTAAKLTRTTFRTSRLLDYFSEKELVNQTGQPRENWPLVLIKELLDNALDACEEHGVAPDIRVTVDDQGVEVSDNGPGIPRETVQGVLDFSIRVSSREAYVSPTRGAQGNALKTIIAMPFVLSGDEQRGRVDISAHGVRQEITLRVDRIQQKPIVECEEREAGDVRNGTCVRVFLPDSACSLLEDARIEFLQMAEAYAWLNPHLGLRIVWHGEETAFGPSDPQWRKWLPSDPTCPHWYRVEHLERLIAAYITHGQENGSGGTVRELMAEFRGLLGSAKQKTVLDAAGLSRARLADLARDAGLDHTAIARLLHAMKAHTRPVKPVALGVIGREHLQACCRAAGAEMETFQYRMTKGEKDGVPWVIEAAFAWMGESSEPERKLVTGVNWSPGIGDPFRVLGCSGKGLEGIFTERWAGAEEPVILVIHVVQPRAQYTDRGKSAVVIEDEACVEEIIEAVQAVTKMWTKQRKAEEREASARARRSHALIHSYRETIKDVAWDVMEEAYMKASGNNTLPAHARQIMYAARGEIQRRTGKQLDDQYFIQGLLPDYMNDHPEKTAEWKVVFDARGHLSEPHTDRTIPLGTLDVEQYLDRIKGHEVKPPGAAFHMMERLFPTSGPKKRYGAILFIEKEGFLPLFDAVKLAERYDLAIMSTKGMSNTASRRLVDALCGPGGIPLLVLHDFDQAGFSILGTLKRDTRRFEFANRVSVIDLGLGLEDVKKHNLEAEDVYYRSDPTCNLRENGATKEEIDFLYADKRCGQRVELNAFTSADLVKWIEGKLKGHGIRKVMPDEACLETAYRRATETQILKDRIEEIREEASAEAQATKIPRGLMQCVQKRLKRNPKMPWDRAVALEASSHRREKS